MNVPRITFKEWCDGCGAFIGKHEALHTADGILYGIFQMAPGMVATGKRTFGPPQGRPRSRPRNGDAMGVSTPGPITVRCLRCNDPREVVVGSAAVLESAT